MKSLLDSIFSLAQFQDLAERLSQGERLENLGLGRAARLPILAALFSKIKKPILLLTNRTDLALTLSDELAFWLPESTPLLFPEPTSIFYENVPWGENTRRERLLTLTTLASTHIPGAEKVRPPLIIAPARAVMSRTIPRREFVKACRVIHSGTRLELGSLVAHLVSIGYKNNASVILPGQFARRGGILDLWPPSNNNPIRLDFFGDEIDTLREFDPASQRTTQKLEHFLLTPAKELITPPENDSPDGPLELNEFQLPLLHSTPANILEYLPKNSLIMVDDWQIFQDTVDEMETKAVKLREDAITQGVISKSFPLPYLTRPEIQEGLKSHQTLELGPVADSQASPIASVFVSGQRFGGQLKPLMDHIQSKYSQGDEVIVVSRQAARLQELWTEKILYDTDNPPPRFIQGSLNEGWMLTPNDKVRVHLITDGEIFGWRSPRPRQRPRLAAEAPESNFSDFRVNELVVHIDHGVGRFKGLVSRAVDGVEHEYLCVEYAGGDQLYVPVHQADRLSRYIGTKGYRPTLNRLGGVEWRRVKSRVKAAVIDAAEEMLAMYASREIADGHAFNPDGVWQQELEASFPYIETEDQIRVIGEVKKDMESDRPMDRLICGDVGFGKTEVALRAAFKAVMDGKQVALLVPTTILAQQHYNTFRQRLSTFPVEVEMLSRFRTPRQQNKILVRLAQGTVDIIIGTHRLVQSDIQFKDLGLVIIDEEQRFGVTHKEHLKQLRTEVDVLTMTATPIPRTLYMALTGVRDISTINTPPAERLPVVSHVGPYSPRLVRQAILRELERGGQVFFVHNRVQTIQAARNQLSRLVPEARITIAHGQMSEKELSKRMLDFTAGDIDVLISTSIIESGLDIPNANTIIIDRADTFGLGQLYQLRGRVGRGAMRAYAYFFRHPTTLPSEDGQLRLETIAENSQLGAGYSIAMRDLEIRGAGDILGTRQHGQIAAVGFHLYTRLLNQAVGEIRKSGIIPEDSILPTMAAYHPLINIDLPIQINIPSEYVPDKSMRLLLYRRLAELGTQTEIDTLEEEFIDRFGPPPESVKNLFYQLQVRLLAELAGVSGIASENTQLVFRFPTLPSESKRRVYPNLGTAVRTGKNALWYPLETSQDWKEEIITILEKLIDFSHTQSTLQTNL